MISYLVFVLVQLLLIFAAPVFQLVLSTRRLREKTKLDLFWVSFIALILGFSLSVCATLIAIYGLPAGTRCATGCMAFLIVGIMITLTTAPIIGIIMYVIFRINRKPSVN